MKKGMIRIKSEKPISFSLDASARALYIAFSTEPVAETVRKNDSFHIDLNEKREIVGIEILHLKKVQATIQQVLKDAESILPSSQKSTLEKYLQLA